jgi:hypothetical protein
MSAPVSRSLTLAAYQDTAAKTVTISGDYMHKVELEAERVTISARLQDAEQIDVVFVRDTLCYPPQDITQVYQNGVNIINWLDTQPDVVQYTGSLYAVAADGTESFVRTEVTADKQLVFKDLNEDTFYRLALQSTDTLHNISVSRSITFYSSPGQIIVVDPLNFTQFADKLVEIAFDIGTFGQTVWYAYQSYPAQLITENVYLYQAFNLLPSKALPANLPVKYCFKLNQLDPKIGGDFSTLALYYYKDDLWQPVPADSYSYEASNNTYTYTGAQFYPLAIGAERFAKWVIAGVPAVYTASAFDLDLLVYAVNTRNEVVTRSARLTVTSSNAQLAAKTIITNADGQGVLPLRLNAGRSLTYNVQVVDETGVTDGLSFYADELPITFNALIVDSWQRVTESVTLKEGTKYLLELDVSAYPGAELSYELAGYIKADLGEKNQFTFRPDYIDAGTHQLEIQVKDQGRVLQTYALTVNVLNINRPPFLYNQRILNVVEAQNPPTNNVFIIKDPDPDDDYLEVMVSNVPQNFGFEKVPDLPLLNYKIQADYTQQGTYNIYVRLSDGIDTVTETVVVVVQNVNRPARIKNNTQVINALEYQFVTYSIEVEDPDEESVTLDFKDFPCPAGVISAERKSSTVTQFVLWSRPITIGSDLSYSLELFDGSDRFKDTLRFNVRRDTAPPLVSLAEIPNNSTYAPKYIYRFVAADNVWTTINVAVYRDAELLLTESYATSNIVIAPSLNVGANDLTFIFSDGVGNQAPEIKHTIRLEDVARFDAATGIYVELPVGAYETDLPLILVTQNPTLLTDADWRAGHLPDGAAQFVTLSNSVFLAVFEENKKNTPLDAATKLEQLAKFALKAPKLADPDQKINPVIWDNERKQWLAHTAKRLTPEEFGVLPVPTASFDLADDEELLYFESPALGLFSLLIFTTKERPRIQLAYPDDYYEEGQNQALFAVKGNYLRLENTKLWLNDATVNVKLALDQYMDNLVVLNAAPSTADAIFYSPSRNLFSARLTGFKQGNNKLAVYAENLVHSSSAVFNLEVNTGKLEVKDIYAYPNPARETGEQMVRFSCNLSKPADINIRIYTNQGHLIRELNQSGQTGFNAVPWDGRDKYNNQTANGMYLYVITIDDGDKKIIQRKKVGVLL